MRITENQLRNIIRDEVLNYLTEASNPRIDFSAAVNELSMWAKTKEIEWESATRDQKSATNLADFLSGNDATVVVVNLQTAVESFKRFSVNSNKTPSVVSEGGPPRPKKTDIARRSGVNLLISLIKGLVDDNNAIGGTSTSFEGGQLSKINDKLMQILNQLDDCVRKSSAILGGKRPEEFKIDVTGVLRTIEKLIEDLVNDKNLKKYKLYLPLRR